MTAHFHARYLELVDAVERRFPVADWCIGGVQIWPAARMDLYLDMYWQHAASVNPPRATPRTLSGSLVAAWRALRELARLMLFSGRSDALFLGDGVCLDRSGEVWSDRFCEPIIKMLEAHGRRALLMQRGDTRFLPRNRVTLYSYIIEISAQLFARLKLRLRTPRTVLQDHEAVIGLLRSQGVSAASLAVNALQRRAAILAAQAWGFEQVLKRTRPSLAFVVTYYAGAGQAFALACRRRGILCVDLQHCPQGRSHKAYYWPNVPSTGYATLPAVFWNWTAEDAAVIDSWTQPLQKAWHRSLYGGHPQLSLPPPPSQPGSPPRAAREILVALQTLAGYRDTWNALAALIESAPPEWRWWIRRHPSNLTGTCDDCAALLALRRANVLIDAASEVALFTMLPRMDAVVSLMSGAAAEAAMLGVPAIFLCAEAQAQHSNLIASGKACVRDVAALGAHIHALPSERRRSRPTSPDLLACLARLDGAARDYARLCKDSQFHALPTHAFG